MWSENVFSDVSSDEAKAAWTPRLDVSSSSFHCAVGRIDRLPPVLGLVLNHLLRRLQNGVAHPLDGRQLRISGSGLLLEPAQQFFLRSSIDSGQQLRLEPFRKELDEHQHHRQRQRLGRRIKCDEKARRASPAWRLSDPSPAIAGPTPPATA